MTDAKKPPFRRTDGAGHLDPKYAAHLRERSREDNPRDDEHAFVDGHRSKDGLAEELAEEAVKTMSSGDTITDDRAEEVSEEVGGPFVTTTGGVEIAEGTDPSNPKEATREPFPKT
jgi:hypothetical protein